MKLTFVFIGTLSKDVPEVDIQSEIPKKIALQQAQFKNGTGDDDHNNIEVVEFSYNEAKPNCWFVFAKWKIK
jgi:hypothetical protein